MMLKRVPFLPVIFFLLFYAIACESAQGKIDRQASEAAQSSGDTRHAPDGAAVFRKNCTTCHGADGTLGLNGAKNLKVCALSLDERIAIITEGKKLMTPFGAILSPEEIKAVAEYTLSLKK